MIEVLSRWNRWGGARLESGIGRGVTEEIGAYVDRPEVLALIGPRRAGKTTVLFQLMDLLESSGVPKEAMLHVNFEEPLLAAGLGTELMENLYLEYREEIWPRGKAYLLLDEVQHVPEWEKWVRARNETEDIKVLVSGSSSALMSREFGTLLTGRQLTFRVHPLSFREFLKFREIELPKKPKTAGSPARIQNALGEYLRWGGFPEVVLEKDQNRKSALLKQYFDDVLFKDVALRHNVRDMQTLRALAVHLLTQTANMVSYHRLSKMFGVSLDLVRAYCSHLEEAFVLALVSQFSLKASERKRNPQKVHAGDLGLRNAVCISGSPDLGRRAETAVFQKLWRRGNQEVYYWRREGEVDFLVRREGKVTSLVQVVHRGLEKESIRRRELNPLIMAEKEYNHADRQIVTARLQKGTIEGIPKGIETIPLWRFLTT